MSLTFPLDAATWSTALIGAVLLVPIFFVLRRGMRASLTLPAVAWTPWISRQLSSIVGPVELSEEEFLSADGAGAAWRERRRLALHRLAATLRDRFPQSAALGDRLRGGLSDLRFTDLS